MNERFNLVRAHHAKTPEGQYYAGVSVVKPGEVVTRETVSHAEHTADTVENAYLGALKGAVGELCPHLSKVNQARAFVDENDRTSSYVQIIAGGAVVTEPVVQESLNGTSYWVQPEGAAVVRAIKHYVVFRSSTTQNLDKK